MDSKSIRISGCRLPRCVISRLSWCSPMFESNMFSSNVAHALLIFVSTFVLEDIAVLGAALLVVNSMVTLPWAAASSFVGIWIGRTVFSAFTALPIATISRANWRRQKFPIARPGPNCAGSTTSI